MKASRASKRYAGALLQLATEMKKVEQVGADMRFIRESIAASHELQLFFADPVIMRAKKRSVVNALFQDKVDDLTLRFLNLLISKGREKLTGGIAVEYGVLLDDAMGIVNAELKAPYPLDDKSQTRVRSRLEGLTGKKVRISFALDKSLVGGFLAQIGDTVYDGSVRRQLELLKHQLSEDVSLSPEQKN